VFFCMFAICTVCILQVALCFFARSQSVNVLRGWGGLRLLAWMDGCFRFSWTAWLECGSVYVISDRTRALRHRVFSLTIHCSFDARQAGIDNEYNVMSVTLTLTLTITRRH
jgi:hypothetical protein